MMIKMQSIDSTSRIGLLIILFSIICSCSIVNGPNGVDGTINLAIDWIENPIYYTDTNPDIPNNLTKAHFYVTETGKYEFKYAYEENFGWEGYYEIRPAEKGQKGRSVNIRGRDGKSVYYTLFLSYRGSNLSNYYEKAVDTELEYLNETWIHGYVITVKARRVALNAN